MSLCVVSHIIDMMVLMRATMVNELEFFYHVHLFVLVAIGGTTAASYLISPPGPG